MRKCDGFKTEPNRFVFASLLIYIFYFIHSFFTIYLYQYEHWNTDKYAKWKRNKCCNTNTKNKALFYWMDVAVWREPKFLVELSVWVNCFVFALPFCARHEGNKNRNIEIETLILIQSSMRKCLHMHSTVSNGQISAEPIPSAGRRVTANHYFYHFISIVFRSKSRKDFLAQINLN